MQKEHAILESLLGKTNANAVCGKAPGTLLICRGEFAGMEADVEFAWDNDIRLTGASAIVSGRPCLSFRTHLRLSDGKIHVTATYRETGWNRAKDCNGQWLDIRDRSGQPIYPFVVIPDEVDVRVEEVASE